MDSRPAPSRPRTGPDAARRRAALAALRHAIADAGKAAQAARPDAPLPASPVPTGDALFDSLLGGGLAAHALHEILPTGAAGAPLAHAPATALAARFAAAAGGETLWAGPVRDLFAPGLARMGLHPARLLLARTGHDRETLAVLEEAIGSIAVLIGEIGRPGPWLMAASRRLQLAARARGSLVLLLHRQPAAARIPTAAVTCWAVASAPSQPAAVRALFPGPGGTGLGQPMLALTLLRARGAAAMHLPLARLLPAHAAPAVPDHAPDRLPLPAPLAGRAPCARARGLGRTPAA